MSNSLRQPALSSFLKAKICADDDYDDEFAVEVSKSADDVPGGRKGAAGKGPSPPKPAPVTAGEHNEPFTISPLLAIDREVTAALSPSRKTVVERSVRFTYAFESKRGSVPLNPRRANQDAHVELYPFAQTAGCALFAVCDGHGFEGARVARFAAKQLPQELERELSSCKKQHSVGDALTSAFMKTNVQLYESEIDVSFSGAVVVACVLDGCDLWVANAGNARAVLGRKSRSKDGRVGLRMVELSIDHTPRRHDECQRVIRRGGRVEPFKTAEGVAIGPPRVWLSHQDAPGLQVTRAVGNSVAATVGIVAEPEVMRKRWVP